MTTRVLHSLSRELEGSTSLRLLLPLCWDAAQRPTDELTQDELDELWWLSWDVGAIEPSSVLIATERAFVTCVDCLEWLHA